MKTPPSDATIEAGLRQAAASDPRAAEVLLRWLARPRPVADGDDVAGMGVDELERLHAALTALLALEPSHVAAFVRQAIAPSS